MVLSILLGVLAAAPAPGAVADPSMPHLRRQGTAVQLVVDGKPFLIRGGELGNSTASNPAHLEPFWPKLAEVNMNTVLAPLYWDLLEPEEGRFDFSSVDRLIKDARASGGAFPPEIVDREDVGVRERGHDASFPLEA